MSIAKRFYDTLFEILVDIDEITPSASLRQRDRIISKYFSISESTARNWRRGRNAQVSNSISKSIIEQCYKIDTSHYQKLQILSSLTSNVTELKQMSDRLVDELLEQGVTDSATWHIYSGPLKLSFNKQSEVENQYSLATQAAILVEQILDLGIDREDIPSIGELIRYSSHSWFNSGILGIREKALSSQHIGVLGDNISTIEKALYLGDLCAITCYFCERFDLAEQYVQRALKLLDNASKADEKYSMITVADAKLLIRAHDVMQRCHYPHLSNNTSVIHEFMTDYKKSSSDSEYAEAKKHEAFGYIDLVYHKDFENALNSFNLSTYYTDIWFRNLQLPISGILSPCLSGYVMLMQHGPSDTAKALMMECLTQIIDLNLIPAQIPARICQAAYYHSIEDTLKMKHHLSVVKSISESYNLQHYMKACMQLFNVKYVPVD